MRFEITNEGRTLFLKPEEKVCNWCRSKETTNDFWYYYDEPFSKGLYCNKCAATKGGIIKHPPKGRKPYQFWLIDCFRYGNEGKVLTNEEAELLKKLRKKAGE